MKWFLTVLIACASALPALGQSPVADPEVGVDEHLGDLIPLDLTFLDEQGQPILLADLIRKPTILTLVYYRCPGICTPLLSGVVEVLEKTDAEPGEDFTVLTISFDPSETPDLAARKRENMLKAFHRPFPPEAWRFLTGDSTSIARLTDAVGFRYVRRGKDFTHPGLLTILTDEGKIARYLYGITFLPFDLKLALAEASQGRVGPTFRRVLLFCFSYDPEGQTYVFNLLKVVGTLVTMFGALFVGFLFISNRRARKRS